MSRRRRGDMLLALAATAVSMTGWVYFESGGDTGASLAWYFGGFVFLGLADGFLGIATSPHLTLGGDVNRDVNAYSRAARPSRLSWLLPLLQIPIMAATLPVAFHTDPGDWSILAVALFLLMFAYAALLASWLLWLMVLLPLAALGYLVVRIALRRPPPTGLVALGWLALLLLDIVGFALGAVLGTRTPLGQSSRVDRVYQVRAVLGFGGVPGHSNVASAAWLWVARLCAVLFVVLIYLLWRYRRSRSRDRRS